MDSHNFLSAVLPDVGHYCLFTIKNKIPSQKLYDSIENVDTQAHRLSKEGYNAYFAVSSFLTDEDRTVENVLHTKALFLDIDCGEDKAKKGSGYATQTDGMEALKKFLKETGMPTPTYVNSGRGWHIYWVLTEAIPYEEWFPVAESLKRLTASKGLICDPAVTSDAARVLRVPQTNNYKDDPPSPVKVMGDEVRTFDFDTLSEIIGDVAIAAPALFKPSDKMKALMKGDNKLTGIDENYENSFKLIMEKTVAGKGCAQLEYILTHQEEVDEPLWRAGLSIAKHCKNSEKIAIAMSSKHKDYSESDTLKKMESIEGPYLCETFDSLNPDVCKDCPNLNNIKSPVVLGKQFIEAPLAPVQAVGWDAEPDSKQLTVDGRPECPFPFKWGKGAGVYMDVKDSDGEITTILVYDHDLYVKERINDPLGEGESIVFIFELPQDGRREFTIPLTKLGGNKMGEALAFEGVIPLAEMMPHVKRYIDRSVTKLQLETKAKKVNRQMGWTDDKTGFVLGGKIFNANAPEGHNPQMATTRHLFKPLEGKGTLDEWSYMANCYNSKGMEMRQMILCMGFGSPLMEMIDNVACSGFHIYSKDSGLGKTSCLNAAISIWGDYKTLVLANKDTANGRVKRISTYKNFLACLDEMTNQEGEVLSEMVYDHSAGKEKVRLNRNSEEMPTAEPWSLISVTTANTSILERIQMAKNNPNAEAQRVMECFFDREAWGEGVDEERFNAALVNNNGLVGQKFIQYVVDNYGDVKKKLNKFRKKICQLFGLTSENRFWSAGLACILLGGCIAKKLGLIDYDMDNLLMFMGTVVKQNQTNLINISESVEDTVNRYVAEHTGGIIRISGKKTDPLTGFTTQQNQNKPVVGRYEKSNNLLQLSTYPFQKWLAKEQLSFKETWANMQKRMGAVEKKQILITKGTDNTPVTVTVLSISNYSEES